MNNYMYPIAFWFAVQLSECLEMLDCVSTTILFQNSMSRQVLKDLVHTQHELERLLAPFTNITVDDAFAVYKCCTKRQVSCVVALERMIDNAPCEFQFCPMAKKGR